MALYRLRRLWCKRKRRRRWQVGERAGSSGASRGSINLPFSLRKRPNISIFPAAEDSHHARFLDCIQSLKRAAPPLLHASMHKHLSHFSSAPRPPTRHIFPSISSHQAILTRRLSWVVLHNAVNFSLVMDCGEVRRVFLLRVLVQSSSPINRVERYVTVKYAVTVNIRRKPSNTYKPL